MQNAILVVCAIFFYQIRLSQSGGDEILCPICKYPSSSNTTFLEFLNEKLNTTGVTDGYCEPGQTKTIWNGTVLGYEENRCCCFQNPSTPSGPEKCADCVFGTPNTTYYEWITSLLNLSGPEFGYCDNEKFIADGRPFGIDKTKCCCLDALFTIPSLPSSVPPSSVSSSPSIHPGC
jgi:hypothetical protein